MEDQRIVDLYWALAALAACLAVVLVLTRMRPKTSSPAEGGNGAPSVTVDGTVYVVSPWAIRFQECPEGFIYSGDTELDGEELPCYTNPEVPEWVYVYQECYDQRQQETYPAYVRYVEESLRGLKFIRYCGQLYADTWTIPTWELDAESQEFYETLPYSLSIEGETVGSFTYAGNVIFEEYDTIPESDFGSNTHESEIWVNPGLPEILLVRYYWQTSQGQHKGFRVYALYQP